MATFNQQHQRVERQINGETIHVNADHRNLVEKIDDLISQARHGDRTDVAGPVLAYLQQARAVSASGHEGGAVALLRRAAEVAGPIATITTSIIAVVQGIQ